MLSFLLLLSMLREAAGIIWVKGGPGQSCTDACASQNGCLENAHWPTSEAEFKAVVKEIGFECESVQLGGSRYDPSTDGHNCGWGGPSEDSLRADAKIKKPRCQSSGDAGTYRFCPCFEENERWIVEKEEL
mmetsp:Transcript_19191/g.35181  ORF Transcript_19191/g.35181 Transcript_19191/m.35181 type:complete len:131 (+) Transcript_19191:16-408(+)